MNRVQDIIGEIEGRIDGLKEDSIKAKEYLQLKEKHRELEINIILKNVEGLETKNEYAEEDLRNVVYNLEKLNEEKAELEGKIAESNARNEVFEESSVAAREKLIEAIDRLNAVVNKDELDRERLAAIDSNTARLTEEIEQLEEKKERELANAEQFMEQKQEMDAEAEAAQEILTEKTENYDRMAAAMKELADEADRLRGDIFQLSTEITAGKAEINSMEMLQETLTRRQETLLGEKGAGEDSNRETVDSLNTARKEREELAAGIEAKRAEAGTLKETYEEKQQKERSLARETEELRIALGRLAARQKTIEEMEANYEGYNNAVKHVMKAGMSGIHGVVAELITVPEGYETAIETALGNTLQNIVCEDEESAKRAIKSLKENKAGRMT
ncbi:MAG: hypothetical protein HUJ79_07310, partial [Firmicutes bacterium]|nr:hypothetical protein [Bacillota bacterium]